MPIATNPLLASSSASFGSASSLLSSNHAAMDQSGSMSSTKNVLLESITSAGSEDHDAPPSSPRVRTDSTAAKSAAARTDTFTLTASTKDVGEDETTEQTNGYRKFGERCETNERMDARQWLLLSVLSLATLTSSFAICLFPPFFPKVAEEKGATASVYGFIIGTNCLTSFLVTPFVGKNLKYIGVRFAFVSGVFIGGVCCILSGFLEWFPPGLSFTILSIAIRAVHAAGNAGTITSTFTYTAVEFPNSMAKIFSLTRTMMNIAQLAGPIAGGALYEVGGFKAPFIIMGSIQTVMAFVTFPFLPDYDASQYDKGNQKSGSPLAILCVPSIWIPFFTFIVSTMSNGFLSINLEPQVLRKFDLTPFYVGIFFGLKDGANSIASPVWGFLCDRRTSVKPYLVLSTLIGATSLFLLGPFPSVPIEQSLAVVGIALALSGISFAGQQVSGVVDAMRQAVYAGYPDNPSTHGLVAGIWSSLSGAGRFVSRSGTGLLVDYIGFQYTAVIVFSVQIAVAFLAIFHGFCTQPPAEVPESKEADKDEGKGSFDISIVEINGYRRVTISQPESPAECLMCKSVSIPLPRKCCRDIARLRSGTVAGCPC